MISHLNQNRLFLFYPAMHQIPVVPQNPFSVFLKVGSFCGCKATHVHVPSFSPVNSVQSSSRSVKRMSRVVRIEAQGVLMDYLHSTRGYNFLDAEYISKNSPRFVEGLVSKIDGQDDDVARALRKFLRELKVEKADLCQIIKDDPLKLISMASKLEQKSSEQLSSHDPRKHLEKTTFLLKLGYAENSEEMAKALKMFRGRGDKLQERFDCLVEAGLDYNSVIEMVKRAPMILNLKKVVIEKKIDFLRNILGFPLECVVRFPTYFCYDLEKIIERFSMYAWLKERNAVNPTLTLSNIVSSNDKRFVKYFVNVHPEGPTIWKGLKSLSNKDKILCKMP